jgi:peptidoglycan/xylan/chitin deacetylase (PgdA/CDA1 family)
MDGGVAGSLLVCAWVVARNVGRGWHRGFAGVTASLIVCVGLWKVSSARVAVVGPTLLSVQTSRPEVALTFDDGPNLGTPHVLDALKNQGVREDDI